MPRHAVRTIVVASLGGIANAAVVAALLVHFDYPLVDSNGELAAMTARAFLLGFVPLLILAHTRLVAPAGGVAILLVGVVHAELTSPAPRKIGELGDNDIVEGPFHVFNYAHSWDVLLALLLVAGVAEFGLRRGYGLGSDRLRNLPDLPLSRPALAAVPVGFGSLVGASTVLLVHESATVGAGETVSLFAGVVAATAVPLTALLARGHLAPLVLFALVVPRFLLVDVFGSPDSYAHIAILGAFAVVLTVVWLLESLLRSWLRDWNGGRFTGRADAG